MFDRFNRIKPNPSPTPKWSEKPLLKSYEKSKPPLGGPTDRFAVPEVCAGNPAADSRRPTAHEVLMNEKVGEIKARSSNATARF